MTGWLWSHFLFVGTVLKIHDCSIASCVSWVLRLTLLGLRTNSTHQWRRKWQPIAEFLPGESQGRGAWWAAVRGAAQSRTRLSDSAAAAAAGLTGALWEQPWPAGDSLCADWRWWACGREAHGLDSPSAKNGTEMVLIVCEYEHNSKNITCYSINTYKAPLWVSVSTIFLAPSRAWWSASFLPPGRSWGVVTEPCWTPRVKSLSVILYSRICQPRVQAHRALCKPSPLCLAVTGFLFFHFYFIEV